MIDIHTHVIPHLDDGPVDMEVSVGMGRIAAEDGITDIISTSHSAEVMDAGREGMERRLEEVWEAWRAAGISVNLHLGVEIYLTPQTASDLAAGRLWPLAGSRYLLVEVPYRPWPTYADDALFDLQTRGYVPILAHPERYSAVQNDPNHMYALAERGILSQVTGIALLGLHGSDAKRCSETLVRHGLAQFISSDAHGLSARDRSPRLREAWEAARALVGDERARALVVDNPAAVIANMPIEVEAQPVPARRGPLGRLFSRD
jgi:protein-tyrosine phosphatase